MGGITHPYKGGPRKRAQGLLWTNTIVSECNALITLCQYPLTDRTLFSTKGWQNAVRDRIKWGGKKKWFLVYAPMRKQNKVSSIPLTFKKYKQTLVFKKKIVLEDYLQMWIDCSHVLTFRFSQTQKTAGQVLGGHVTIYQWQHPTLNLSKVTPVQFVSIIAGMLFT